MKIFSTIFLALMATGLVVGCGDVKTPQDVISTRNREQIKQRLTELKPLVGDFEGQLLDSRSDRYTRFHLNIVLSGVPYDGAGVPEETASPTVVATALVYSQDSAGLYVPVEFTSSDYDAKEGRLSLFGDKKGSTIIIEDLKDSSMDNISGTWTDNNRSLIGTFTVQRTNRLGG